MSTCHFCGVEIDLMCDVCERHALTMEQSAEMMRRIQAAQLEYYIEIWPELKERLK